MPPDESVTCDVSGRPGKAHYEAVSHGISQTYADYRDRAGRSLCGESKIVKG
jgi:hypothetical protein